MNIHVYTLIRIVHMASMAVWFAAALWAPGDLRRSLGAGKPHWQAVVGRVQRTLRVSVIAAALTIASGVALLFAHGGFAAVSPRIHAGLGITLVALAIEVVVLGPAFSRIAGDVEADAKPEEVVAGSRRFSAVSGVLHLLRFTVLVLMVYRA